jgi:FdhE protein
VTHPEWDRRIRRAEKLSEKFPASAEILMFYRVIAKFQRDLHSHFASTRAPHPLKIEDGSIRGRIDAAALSKRFPAFLSIVGSAAPGPLAEFARELHCEQDSCEGLLQDYWENGCRFEPVAGEQITFCARAYLQPYAEYLAAQRPHLLGSTAGAQYCPVCRSMPQVGVLRPEGDGARRSLVCPFCATEWVYRRIVCPSCGEEDEKQICVYIAKELEYIRVEACETCKTYIETIDMTKDGHAVPIVDELVCLPLSLWATEQGYHKLQRNLFGL